MNYSNPILYTDYSDPDVVRVGKDFYMVASSFANTPALPILHSVNLVDWEIIGYVADRLPFDYYDFPMHGCGVWAPSIRYNNGLFYCFVPMPDEGIFVYKTKDIYGKWDAPVCIVNKAGWIDPCPLFDEDGRVYMVNAFAKSRIGFKEMLHVCELNKDCTEVIDTGHFVFDGTYNQPTVEGPKFYRRNGYYYIFAPAGGVKTGWQLVLRSKNIYGPYEERIVLKQGDTKINGPHQGALVDTEDGENWFFHFQDVGNGGRIVHLQPVLWEEDWPIIGKPIENESYGVPVLNYKCPAVKTEVLVDKIVETPLVKDGQLNLNWQWNANYRADWYLAENHSLKLYAKNFLNEANLFNDRFKAMLESNTISEDLRFSLSSDKGLLANYPNLLTLKLPSEKLSMRVVIGLDGLKANDETGIGVLGDKYSALMIKRTEKGFLVREIQGERTIHPVDADPGVTKNLQGREQICFEKGLAYVNSSYVELGLELVDSETVVYGFRVVDEGQRLEENSETDVEKTPAAKVTPGRWVGAKLFIFSRNEIQNSDGFANVLKLDLKR